MESICGANCDECMFNKKCKGCKNTNGCPFGKKCFIASYIEIGGKEHFELLQKALIDEINSLEIEGMPKLNELFPLHGSLINLEYMLPSGKKSKILDDNDSYLGNQLENKEVKKCFGIACNMSFILISEYEENGVNPEIIIYKRR